MKEFILITGAAQRVGLYCAKALQQRGFQVIISYRTRHPSIHELEELGVECIQVDLTDLASLEQFVLAVFDKCPHLRAVIHNASDWQPDPDAKQQTQLELGARLQQDATVFDAMSHIHARAAFLLNRALLPLLEKYTHIAAKNLDEISQRVSQTSMVCTGLADILHLTDFVATVGSEKHQAYAASKAAVENLTYSLARQLAPKIKVNAIAPALLMFNVGDDLEYQQKALKKSLLGLAPGPQEVFSCIELILQSTYITGRVLPLDGGRHLRLP